ncbi:2-aminoethylphosphonate--pyruvate transaminase, partial [bacterium]|nr:2-aminoethylphosphonate--pyruvate transaminase [bacterium]
MIRRAAVDQPPNNTRYDEKENVLTTSTWKDKALFTPGPLTTSRTVKQAMLRDLGSRDGEFIAIVRDVRERLVRLAEVDIDTHTTVLMQGSGTFGLEAVLATCVPRGKKLLCAINGAYGRRMAAIGRTLGIDVVELSYAEDAPIVSADIEKALTDDADIAMVTCCHCETTSGILNPIAEVGAMVQAAGRDFYVDAMSSFGAIDTNVAEMGIDYLVSSANKCIEGVPGFSFCVAKLDKLLACEGNARSISLDLVAQYKGLESNGQFRFTPPTHAILAFHQALLELEEEGGVAGRGARYRANHEIIAAGMTAMGF